MKWICFLALTCSCCGLAIAEELTLLNGKSYSDFQVTRKELDGITIKHSAGITKIYFWELPSEIQSKYGYEPSKAHEYNRNAQAKQAMLWEKQKEAAERRQLEADYEKAHKDVMETIKASATEMVGIVRGIIPDGAFIFEAKVPYRYKEEVVTPGYTPLPSNRKYVTKTKYIPVVDKYQPIFIIGAGQGFTDGDRWKSVVYAAGIYKNPPDSDTPETLKCFALSPETAFRHLMK